MFQGNMSRKTQLPPTKHLRDGQPATHYEEASVAGSTEDCGEHVDTHIGEDNSMPLQSTRIGLGMRSANERRRYIVTTPLFGWAHRLIPDSICL